ncbi:protein spinster homolog 1-like [Protopterus annectens]|uniref:protein spinster homolog 1-like n=1 Tax=Protopterus annectens TaxID=7888 RepID=UPI001CF9465B|nr:protein spinster homolog 1-like [Protopterus annectens]
MGERLGWSADADTDPPVLTLPDNTGTTNSVGEHHLSDGAAESFTDNGDQCEENDTDTVTGMSRRHSVLVVLILFYINLLNYMDRFTVAGVLPEIQTYFNKNDSETGLLQTVFICSYMVLAPVFGYLGDRYNRKIIMCCGITFWCLVTLASSFITEQHFWLLLLTRGLVGVGEASYSTIASTIIADLFVADLRSRMLSVFYFAIPVGSGLGYIVGSKVKDATGDWHWSLRVTPALGVLAVGMLIFFVKEPPRGAMEHGANRQLVNTSWFIDVKALIHNPSFILSSLGFTAVAFVTGALALWAPTYLIRSQVVQGTAKPCIKQPCVSNDSLIFGVITCITGFLGVGSGVEISKWYRKRNPRSDPLVCAAGLLISAPFLYLALVCVVSSITATYVFIFIGETFLSLNWALVADIVLYVVIPTRRATASALQIVLSHLLGDAGSPYIIGVISDQIRAVRPDSFLSEFRSLEYSLMICSFVSVIGGAFFLATAVFIENDRKKAELQIKGALTINDDDVGVHVPPNGTTAQLPVSSDFIC